MGAKYSPLSDTQVDFFEDGKAIFTCLRRSGLCGIVSKDAYRLKSRSTYRITVCGTAIKKCQPLLYATDLKSKRSILDRDDLLLPLADEKSASGVTCMMTNTSTYPIEVRLGVKLVDAKVGEEFSLEWIRIEEMDVTSSSSHWRTVSDSSGYVTSYYDKKTNKWINAHVTLRPSA